MANDEDLNKHFGFGNDSIFVSFFELQPSFFIRFFKISHFDFPHKCEERNLEASNEERMANDEDLNKHFGFGNDSIFVSFFELQPSFFIRFFEISHFDFFHKTVHGLTMKTLALILPAAGKSTRFGGPRSKLLEELDGIPVIRRAIEPFLAHPDLTHVIIPCGDPKTLATILPNDNRIQFCAGGTTRADSVLAALKKVPSDVEWVAVHDAARPLISAELIEKTWLAAQQYGAAVPAMPAALTIKKATGPLPARVQQTLHRHELWTMQTPQIMQRDQLLAAFHRCPIPLEQVTDDVQLLELAGFPVWLIAGEERNLKVTTAIDLHLAKWWLGN